MSVHRRGSEHQRAKGALQGQGQYLCCLRKAAEIFRLLKAEF